MERNNNMNHNGNEDDNDGNESPNPNRGGGGGGMNFNEGQAAFAGGQMMNPMAFMAQYQGMMGNMPNNPQNMMNMMGAYCQTANSGGGNMGMGPYGGFRGDGPGPQGVNPQVMAQMQMMARKRNMEDFDGDEQPPAAKRGNFGVDEQESAADANANSDPTANEDTDLKLSPSDPRKEHATVPPSKEGIKFYSRNDVLCGRGGGTNVHPGNRRFRDLINANRRAYLKARKNDKPAISRSIVRTIREMNGRFLKKDEKQGLWFEIGDDGAREKTSQALRQRAPEMRKILFEDEQRQQHVHQAEMMQRHQLMGMGQGMQGMGPMGPGGNMGNFAASMGGNPAANGGGGGNGDISQSLLAKYNMLHQKNWLAQEKSMILQRLAMSGINPNSVSAQSNAESMATQTLLQQGMKPVTPRGA